MAERKKPDFSVDVGTWINPTFLSDKTRLELLGVFQSNSGKKVEPRLRNSLIDFANDYLQYRSERDEPTSVIRDQLAEVAEKAGELMTSMELLRRSTLEELHADTEDAARFGEPHLESEIAYRITRVDEARFLDAVWGHVSALKAIADTAKTSVEQHSKQDEPDQEEATPTGKLSRQGKPDQVQARWLVAELTRHYMQLTSVVVPPGQVISRFGDRWPGGIRVPGLPPPKNPAGWFAEFVALLGKKMGLKIGPRLVVSGIELALNPPKLFEEDVR